MLWAIRAGLWVIPFLPLYISSSMLFPFITGKNFTFRIIIEIIFALWVALAAVRAEYRPKLTPVFKAATVFLVVVFIADLLGPNPYRSFFSNYERMEGFIMILHLYLYFVMLVSVFKTRRDWLIFFHSTIAASVIVSFYALLQKLGYKPSLQGGFRVDSTIGNPTYLAAYLLFHLWLVGMLISQFWKRWWATGLYGAVLAFELAILYFTATRGVILALLATTLIIAVLLVAFFPRVFPGAGRRARGWAGAALAVLVLVPLFLWSIRGTDFVRHNLVLERLTNYSFTGTISARAMIWNMSWQGVKERPIFGWGQENYYLIFQKFYDPGLYAQEPWFDRSHNIVFDWLISAGIVGFLAYLALFGAVFWMLFVAIRNGSFGWWQGMLLGGLFVSYAMQNFFVFDNLNTYILFFAFLAYAAHAAAPGGKAGEAARPQQAKPADAPRARHAAVLYGTLAGALVLVSVGMYFVNIKGLAQSRALVCSLQVMQLVQQSPQSIQLENINAFLARPASSFGSTPAEREQVESQRKALRCARNAMERAGQTATGLATVIAAFEQTLRYDSFGAMEAREQIARAVSDIIGNTNFSEADRRQFAEFAVAELRKETLIPAKDVKHLIMLATILNAARPLIPEYGAEAERALKEAIELSPTKQMSYFELAQLYLNTGNTDGAIDALRRAWEVEPAYTRAASNLLFTALVAKRTDVVQDVTSKIGLEQWDEGDLYRLGIAYRQLQDFQSALAVYERLVKLNPERAEYQMLYGALLVNFQRLEEARPHLEEAQRLDPSLAKEVVPMLNFIGSKSQK